jgi:hypothetical protein
LANVKKERRPAQVVSLFGWLVGFAGSQAQLGNPIPIECVPISMGISPAAIFADQGAVRFAAFAPAPADGGQMKAADGLVTNGAVVTFFQAVTAIESFGGRVFITEYAEFYRHGFLLHNVS